MKPTILTFVTFLFVTAARAADLATTFHFDPTLSREANPVVAQFGAGAAGMLLANAAALVALLFVPLLCFWLGQRPRFAQRPTDVWAFASLAFYRRLMPRRLLLRALITLWPLPKEWFQVCRAWGVVGSWAAGFASVVAALSWWAIASSPSYHAIYAAIAFRQYPIIPLLAGLFGAAVGWRLFVSCEFPSGASNASKQAMQTTAPRFVFPLRGATTSKLPQDESVRTVESQPPRRAFVKL